MAKNPLFSTYRQGENRVTSSMLAVFERIDLSILEALLTAVTGEGSLQLVTFVNQPAGGGDSVPDARISAHFAYWFEVKTARNALDRTQLREHLESLDSTGTGERLFVITPDPVEPPAVMELGDERVVWFSFRSVHDAIDTILDDTSGLVSEHARFLLRELQALLVEDGLVDNDDVVVVAARDAYPEYLGHGDLNHGFYVCQPDRIFREGLTHIGFYVGQAIQREIPRVLHREATVPFTSEEIARRRDGGAEDQWVADTIEAALSTGIRTEGAQHGIFILTGPHDPATLQLAAPIANDTTASTGRRWAWTLGHRYTSLAKLTRPGVVRTSQLADAPAPRASPAGQLIVEGADENT